ncbi:MAG TPA: MotA/TolQ/ExbB proton channel family protein [Xanthomonadaceae bacterium]|nr:MotA/TolQ/ExbB proton channel family protein [Xanthomonadaceae bacterium]
MNTQWARGLLVAGVLWMPLVAGAQEPAAPSPPPPGPAPQVSLEQAYKREYALLEAQKRELEQQLAQTRQALQAQRARLESQIGRLETSAIQEKAAAEALADELAQMHEREIAAAERSDLLAATFEQAGATLGSLGEDALAGEEFAALPDGDKLDRLFALAGARLGSLGRITRQPGSFHLADGSEVQGTIVRFGNIAAFGVSGEHAGALAPAGGGRFRLWPAAAAESANALARGRQPEVLHAFVFENANAAVSDPERKTVTGEVAKGGMIGWVIVILGAIALVLAALRAVFLKRAGASIGDITDAVTPQVRAGRIEEAIATAKRRKGSAARVVTAALRNLDRDREHLEDIVSESILHESSRLNRFGSAIMVIAAVAPLLGLLGTVTGMIQTFDVITEFGTSDPKLLSGGIATALVTTELGLIVAIPALLFGNLLNGWAAGIGEDMEKAALKVVNVAQDVRAESLQRAAA